MRRVSRWGAGLGPAVLMSASFLAVPIPMVLFLVFQKQFLKGGGMSGGIKR